jgi:hypothetical protein
MEAIPWSNNFLIPIFMVNIFFSGKKRLLTRRQFTNYVTPHVEQKGFLRQELIRFWTLVFL